MIPVLPAQEPATFDAAVRQPGLRSLRRMLASPAPRGRGRPRNVYYPNIAAIPSGEMKPEWTKAIPAMLVAFRRTCAYSALHIPEFTGFPTVDHFIPKVADHLRAYDWDNFRLASHTANRLKDQDVEFVDPFTMPANMFALDPATFHVALNPATQHTSSALAVANTLRVLNDGELVDARRDFVDWYLGVPDQFGRPRGPLSFADLQILAPFVARELDRQNRRRAGD